MGALQVFRPFREDSDNTIVICGQGLIFLWIYFLLLRIVGVGQGTLAVLGGVALVMATIGFFTFASYEIRAQLLRKTNDASNEDETVDNSKEMIANDGEEEGGSSQEGAEPQEIGANEEPSHGHISPQDIEIELATADTDGEGDKPEGPNSPPAVSGEGEPPAWLARVVGGHLCLKDPQQDAL